MKPIRSLIMLLLAILLTLASGASAQSFPIAIPGTEGLRVIVASPGEVVATYRGNSATYSNDLYFGLSLDTTDHFVFNNHSSPVGSQVVLGTFPVGTELFFRLHVNNTNNDFYTGPAERNPDGHAHARVQGEWQPGETLVSFEDLYNGPFNYNDLSFSFTNTDTCAVFCDAGGPYGGDAGTPVVFDGSASYSTCGAIIDWTWDFGDGSQGSGATVNHTYAADGIYVVELCVTDDQGKSACCTVGEAVVPDQPMTWGSLKAGYR